MCDGKCFSDRLNDLHRGTALVHIECKFWKYHDQQHQKPWSKVTLVRDIDNAVIGEGATPCDALTQIERQMELGR